MRTWVTAYGHAQTKQCALEWQMHNTGRKESQWQKQEERVKQRGSSKQKRRRWPIGDSWWREIRGDGLRGEEENTAQC